MFPSFLISAVKLHPFLFSFPPIQISPVVFWKGGYTRCYCMISQSLSSQPLKRRRADQSWVIPAVKPHSGQDPSRSHHHRDSFPFLSNPSTFFLLRCATETILYRLNRFSGHFWGPHKAARLCELTWEYLSWLRPLKINKRTEALSLVKWWDFTGGGKKQLPRAWWTLRAWGLCRGRAAWANKHKVAGCFQSAVMGTLNVDEL